MNVIVSNKQKSVLDNANIDAIKDLNGLFNVDELINNFKGYFFSKMIIDATSIIDFAKEPVLRKLVDGIGAEKIILLLPPKPEPPKKFCELLVNLGIYNFSTNINEVVKFLTTPNTINSFDDAMFRSDNIHNNDVNNQNQNFNSNVNNNFDNYQNANLNNPVIDKNRDNKLVLGFKNVTDHAGSTTLIYALKQQLEKNFACSVEAIEIGNSDFNYFSNHNMINVNANNIEIAINNSKCNVILIDLNSNNYDTLCDDVIYLVEPSMLKINKLLFQQPNAFANLQNKKVVLNKSMLSDSDVSIFAKEAGIRIYYNIPPINERNTNNKVIDEFINKLALTNKGGHGLFGIFK